MSIATLITALSALLTGFYLWYDRRARLIVSIEPLDRVYCLTIENVGKSVAKDIKISISNDFIDSLPVYTEERGGRIKQKLLNIQSRKFYFAPGIKKYFFLIQCPKSKPFDRFDLLCNEWHEHNKFTPFTVNVTYNGWYDTTCEFFIEQFNTEAILYKDPTTRIADSLKGLNTTHEAIAKDIHQILENINNQNNNAEIENAEP